MKVSVIVPVYNVERYIEKCLLSLLRQDFADYEIIAVLDGPTDGSREIVEAYAKRYPQLLRVIRQDNAGPGAARNRGLQAASGTYILFVDGDDTVAPELLSTAWQKAETEHADLVCFDINYVDEQGGLIRTESAGFRDCPEVRFDDRSLLLAAPCVWNKLIRSDLLKGHDIRFPDKELAEDLSVMVRLYACAGKAVHLEYPLYNYVQRSESLMNDHRYERTLQLLDIFDELIQDFRQHGRYELYHDELEFIAVYHGYLCGSMHVNRNNCRSRIQRQICDYVEQQFPEFRKNPYIKRLLSRNERLKLWLLDKQWYGLLHLLDLLHEKGKL